VSDYNPLVQVVTMTVCWYFLQW